MMSRALLTPRGETEWWMFSGRPLPPPLLPLPLRSRAGELAWLEEGVVALGRDDAARALEGGRASTAKERGDKESVRRGQRDRGGEGVGTRKSNGRENSAGCGR